MNKKKLIHAFTLILFASLLMYLHDGFLPDTNVQMYSTVDPQLLPPLIGEPDQNGSVGSLYIMS